MRRNDALTLDEVAALAPSHIILSPGPCTPAEAGISTDLVRRFGPTTPILGVCLGHQCIGAAYGGDIVRAGRPVHGRTSPITHDGIERLHRPAVAASRRALPLARDRARHRCRRRCACSRSPTTTARSWRSSIGRIRCRRAVPSRVGGDRVRLRDARSLPARRRARAATCRPAPTAPTARAGRRTSAASSAPFVPPPVELVR